LPSHTSSGKIGRAANRDKWLMERRQNSSASDGRTSAAPAAKPAALASTHLIQKNSPMRASGCAVWSVITSPHFRRAASRTVFCWSCSSPTQETLTSVQSLCAPDFGGGPRCCVTTRCLSGGGHLETYGQASGGVWRPAPNIREHSCQSPKLHNHDLILVNMDEGRDK